MLFLRRWQIQRLEGWKVRKEATMNQTLGMHAERTLQWIQAHILGLSVDTICIGWCSNAFHNPETSPKHLSPLQCCTNRVCRERADFHRSPFQKMYNSTIPTPSLMQSLVMLADFTNQHTHPYLTRSLRGISTTFLTT